MDQSKLQSVPPTPTKNQQEVGVCGTGKHRVININPMLLTPVSASKMHPHKLKGSNKRKVVPGSASAFMEERKIESTSQGSAHEVELSTDSMPSMDLNDGTDEGSVSETSNTSYDLGTPKDRSPLLPTIPNTELQETRSSNDTPKKFNAAMKSPPLRERTIQISPSLLLPVTAMPSSKRPVSTNGGIGVASRDDVPIVVNDYGLRKAASTSSSLSDLHGSRLSVNEDFDGLSTCSEAQDSCRISHADVMHGDYEGLKESLRLADADIAILVSSKQQLQLDLHIEVERAKALSLQLLDADEKSENAESTIQDLRSVMSQKEEFFNSTLENLQSHLQHSTAEMDLLRNSLDVSRATEESQKLEIGSLQHTSGEQIMKLERFEKQNADLTNKNRELEHLLKEATTKDEGIELFMRHLTEVKDDVSAKLQEKVLECEKLQIENKMLAAKCADIVHTNEHLMEKSSKHETRFRETDAENIKLQSKLAVETREKVNLNSAVMKLRSDLGKVETSFHKLKKQFLEKTATAQRESSKRAELEGQVQSLTNQISKLNNLNTEMRIRDKNVQIEQLLTQSRTSSLEKTKLEKEVEKLREHIEANEKSWVNAIQREKKVTQSMKEKDDIIALKVKRIDELKSTITKEQIKFDQLKDTFESSEQSYAELKKELHDKDQRLEELQRQEKSTSLKIEQLEREIASHKDENDKSHSKHLEETTKMMQKSENMEREIEQLQKLLLSLQEENESLKVSNNSPDIQNDSTEENHIQQLQLLSELQSARRELSHENEILSKEKADLKIVIEALEKNVRELDERVKTEHKSHEDKVKEMVLSRRQMESDFAEHILNLEEKLKQSEDVKKLIGNDMKMLKEQSEELSKLLETSELRNHEVSDDLKSKNQENEELTLQMKNCKEEMDLTKQELSNVMMQLTESIKRNEDTDDRQFAEIEKLQKERDMLKNAVIKQQDYCVSLQKHYQDWAKTAELKMREEVLKARKKAEENSPPIEERLGDMKTKEVLLTNHHNASREKVQEGRVDAHESENPIHSLSTNEGIQKEPTRCQDGSGDRREAISYNSTGDLGGRRNVEVSDNSTQTNETMRLTNSISLQTDNQAIDVQIEDTFKEKYDREISMLIEEKIKLLQENTQQAEIIVTLEDRIAMYSALNSSNVEDSFTQTSLIHESVSTNVSLDGGLLEDASIQTDSDSFMKQESAVESEISVMKIRQGFEQQIESLANENGKLKSKVSLLETSVNELQLSSASMLEDSGTQTDHDETLLAQLPDERPHHERHAELLEDAWTQTEKDDVAVQFSNHDLEITKEDLFQARSQVKELTEKLEKLTLENTALTSNYKDLQNSSRAVQDAQVQTLLSNDPTSQPSTVTSTEHVTSANTKSSDTEQQSNERNENMESGADHIVLCTECGNHIPCETEPQNAPLPSPMAILQTMESKKLKAYKKTVIILKKKLNEANKTINNLQTEINVLLEHRARHSENNVVDHTNLKTLKKFDDEMYSAKKRAALQLEEVKRKALADKKILESKVAKLSERLEGLTESNKELRQSVECLQVKLTERSRQTDIATKEKNRYQMRARRLQTSLRSLAWITGNQEKHLFISEDLLLDDSLPEHAELDSSLDIRETVSEEDLFEPRSPSTNSSKASLPASVVEIEASLKDLQSEIIALEKQMQEHNTAVRKSKNQWTLLRQGSQDDTQHNQIPQPALQKRVETVDEIAAISEVV